MLSKKSIFILILIAILSVWNVAQILASISSNGCNKCCADSCRCSKPLKSSCEKKAQVKETPCDSLPIENIQAALPNSVKEEYKSFREIQTAKFAIIPPNVKLTSDSSSYYLEYFGNTQSLLPYMAWFQYRAPPKQV